MYISGNSPQNIFYFSKPNKSSKIRKKYYFLMNYIFARKSIFDRNFGFWEKIDCWQKFWFLSEISIFVRNFDFWQKFRFLTEISIFEKKLIFDRNFDFCQKISIFLTEIWRKFFEKKNWFLPKFDPTYLTKMVRYNISVIGASGPIPCQNAQVCQSSELDGIGKSSFCARFMYPDQDEYSMMDKRSIINSIDFASNLINYHHTLWWGNTVNKDGPTFSLLEQTVFVDDSTLKGNIKK